MTEKQPQYLDHICHVTANGQREIYTVIYGWKIRSATLETGHRMLLVDFQTQDGWKKMAVLAEGGCVFLDDLRRAVERNAACVETEGTA